MRKERHFVVFIFICLSAITMKGIQLHAQPMEHSGIHILMFLDKFCIEDSYGLEYKFQKPELQKDFLFKDDNPNFLFIEYVTVIYDEEIKKYRMWYITHMKRNASGDSRKALCYAESEDGLTWDLNTVPKNTDRYTPIYKNAVFSGQWTLGQGAVSLIKQASDPSRKFIMVYMDENRDKKNTDTQNLPMHIAFSGDGINWEIDKNTQWHPNVSDTKNNIFYNSIANKYQIICRAVNADRRIAMVESKDMLNWSEPRIIIHPSNLDPLGMQFYGMPVFEYEGIYLGMLWKFQTGTIGDYAFRMDGYIEPELTYSYDGITWQRSFRTFIERTPRGTYGGAGIYGESLVVDHEGDIRIYSRGNLTEHQDGSLDSVLIMHKLRRDGFVGLESYGTGGYLKTKPFILDDEDIRLNIQAPYGKVKVEISDKYGHAYPGYSFDESIEWSGDEVFYTPRWKSKENLKELIGKTIRFEVKIVEGTIFAIRARLRPFHGSVPQKNY